MTPAETWRDAVQTIRLLGLNPAGLGGIVLRAQAGPVRDAFLALLPGPVRRMPAGIADDALLGGLDVGATLQAGRSIRTRGLLETARGATLLAAMAERMPAPLAARVTAAMDRGAGFGVVALDEGIDDDERADPGLADRLAFHIDLAGLGHRDCRGAEDASTPADPAEPQAAGEEEIVEALCATSIALGIASPRAPILALRAARAAAALSGRSRVSMDDAAAAARLVLAPRATRLPSAPPEDESPQEPPPSDESDDQGGQREDQGEEVRNGPSDAAEILLEAARAAIPEGLLAQLAARAAPTASRSQGQAGARQTGHGRGRPVGVRAQAPGAGLRLNLIETLRAAAPWQRVRAVPDGPLRVQLRREDFRVTRTERRARSTTIFLVDASGSSALNRLAEAKGAVELLLADCYRRRDQVAVLAFRGRGAQLILPPTRSLVRAKRSLAALPGGGGTPLAAALDAGLGLAETVRRSGATPTIVLLTDGRANVTRGGQSGRAEAARDATASARRLRAAGIAALLLDTSPRPAAEAAGLAAAMGARYVPMPFPRAADMSAAIRAVSPPA